jgi:hypothetical protein
MDHSQFDRLTRALVMGSSRRDLLLGFASAAVGLIATRFTSNVDAKKKHTKKHNKQQKQQQTPVTPPVDPPATSPETCTPSCGGRTCGGGDGCGGSCGTCAAGQLCLDNGSCATTCDVLGGVGCPAGCSCPPSVGVATGNCTEFVVACTDIPQVCTSSAECPPGQSCQSTGCVSGGQFENRCIPLCTG